MDLAKLKDALRKYLPLAQFVAKWSPTPYDDIVVAFLEKFLALDDEKAKAMMSQMDK